LLLAVATYLGGGAYCRCLFGGAVPSVALD